MEFESQRFQVLIKRVQQGPGDSFVSLNWPSGRATVFNYSVLP